MANDSTTDDAVSIASLKTLEYDLRRSITLREDLDDDAEAPHREAALRCGIDIGHLPAKGDLLNAVQTALRSLQAAANRQPSRDGSDND